MAKQIKSTNKFGHNHFSFKREPGKIYNIDLLFICLGYFLHSHMTT